MYYEGGNALHFMKLRQGLSFMTNMEAEKDTMQIKVLLVGTRGSRSGICVEIVSDQLQRLHLINIG